MKRLAWLLLLLPLLVRPQDSRSTCHTLAALNRLLQRDHYRPKPVDDSLSAYVFDKLVDYLDENHLLFLEGEYDKLAAYRLSIDDAVRSGDCSVLDAFVSTYRSALERRRAILLRLKESPLQYVRQDSMRFRKDAFPFEKDEAQLTRYWSKRLAFEVMDEVARTGTRLDSVRPLFDKLEPNARAKAFDTNLCKVNSLLDTPGDIERDLRTNFLNFFCTYFDPHTNYFSSDARTSFVSQLSPGNLSLGLYVSLNEREEVVVDEIVPGGPAARSQQFEKGDVVVKVGNGNGLVYAVSCASLETIGDFMFSDANLDIVLTVRKKNGTLLEVPLRKKFMRAEDTSAYSFVAEKDGTKVGYIVLPQFYTDFNNSGDVGCSEDVRREILKLQQENVDGIVLDLQDNGGGSMEEAQSMVGLFIESGPVALLSDRRNRQTVLKDPDKGIAYRGPLVVLINGNSASASEFFTSAMQDYNRAVVAGTQSLGKATMQAILPLDESKQDEFAKVTLQKFYRITGESAQMDGIKPNVAMPVLFDSLVERERQFDTALQRDKLESKARFRPFDRKPIEQASRNSQERVASSPLFGEIRALNAEINRLYSEAKPPLRVAFDDVFREIHSVDPTWKKVKELVARPTACKVTNNSTDLLRMQQNDGQLELNAAKLKDAQANPYLEEAIAIIADLKKFTQRP